MKNKYYTPEYSDIHIGQELYTIDGYKIDLSTVDSLTWFLQCQNCYIDCEENTTYGISLENYKLKYLDSSDIEELGFKKIIKDQYYYDEWINPIILLIDDDMFVQIINKCNGTEYYLFQGTIKNKSELKKVLNMLNIK